jgi:Fur family zinc uptake transcriptional regulator
MDKKRLYEILHRAERLCQERGTRLTDQRRMVLELVCVAERPLSAYEILDLMRTKLNNPTPPTVYRALDFLVVLGLVHKLETLHAFVGCTHPEYPHSSQFLICVDCGEVNELEDDLVDRSLRCAEKAIGFETKRRVVELVGSCAHCSKNSHDN